MIYLVCTSILLFYALYMFLTTLAALFYKAPKYSDLNTTSHSVLIFYPAFKPNEQLINRINELNLQISGINAKIYVLSQDGKAAINTKLEQVTDFLDTKSFSHLTGNSYHHALEYAVRRIENFEIELGQKFDSVLIMDPDNQIDIESIKRLIKGRELGAHVVLSRRIAANQQSSISLFDGLSERINDYMLRRAKNVLNLTPELAGSGMMLDTRLFQKAVLKLDKKAPGMDKQLLINMMFECVNLNILFDEKAIVFDEKTEDETSFNRQRLRWFGNQYYNAIKFGWNLLKSGKLNMIDYAIALWRPPRSVQIAATFLFTPFELLLFGYGWISIPIISISAFLILIGMILFLCKEKLLGEVIKNIVPFLKTAQNNMYSSVESLATRNEGKFIHTREN